MLSRQDSFSSRKGRVVSCLAMLVGSCIGFAPITFAATFTVNSTADVVDASPGDGICDTRRTAPPASTTPECTLRAAIQEANASPGADSINLPAGTYTLTIPEAGENAAAAGDLDITDDLTLTGAGQDTTIIQACMVDQKTALCPEGQGIRRRIFVIPSGVNVTMTDVTIQNGGGSGISNSGAVTLINSTVGNNASPGEAGGIGNNGTVALIDSTVNGNAAGAGSDGGGILNNGGAVTLTNSTVSGNTAARGGGIFNRGGAVTLTNSTVSGNRAGAGSGGGIFSLLGTVNLNNVTITNNSSTFPGGGLGLSGFGEVVNMRNTIVAGNINAAGYPDCGAGGVISQGFNLVGSGCGGVQNGVNGDQVGDAASPINPLLAPLGPYGGPTQTHALLPGSPAIDAGNPAGCTDNSGVLLITDQRGQPRSTICDIGAFEFGGFALSLSGIRPERTGNTGRVVALIYGSGFANSALVKLTRSGEADIVGNPVKIHESGAVASASFDLTGKASGLWDLVVTNPDGTSATLDDAFTIEEGGAPQLWIDVIGRTRFRFGRPVRFFIVYGNRGNVDALGVPIGITFPKEFSFDLSFPITPPPPRTGQGADWSQVPITAQTGEQSNFTSIPLLLPVVPAGFVGVLELTLTAPRVGLFGAITFGIGSPYFQSGLNPRVVAAFIQGAQAYAQRVFDPVAFPPDEILKQYLDTQLESVISLGSGALIDSVGTKPPVYSLGHLLIDLAQFAAAHGGASSQSAFTPQLELERSQRAQTQAQATGWVASISRLFVSAFLQAGQAHAQVPPWNFQFLPGVTCDDLFNSEQGILFGPNGLGGVAPCTFPDKLPEENCEDPEDIECVLEALAAWDPNDKVGSQGETVAGFLSGEEPLRYAVYFENDPDLATAPAQEVVITDQLDANLDLDSFSFGPISFGDTLVVPTPGLSEFTRDVDLRPARDLLVRINARLDKTTGLVTWRFTSLDPVTQEPPADPLAGFLPPNVNPPEGDGAVVFTVKYKSDLATGTRICNQANIIFDTNDPILTPQWCNTLDNAKPSSQVLPLAASQASTDFLVQWTGADEGAGIQMYSIFVAENDGPFVPFVSFTQETSATFSGQPGKKYAFYSVAWDKALNMEDAPTAPDVTTTIDLCPDDPAKIVPGVCGCGVADTDGDGDETADCNDQCPTNPQKAVPGACGCGVPDTDSDGDGIADCNDGCTNDPNKTAPGICGCGVADTDSDGDGAADCEDACPNDAGKTAPGVCGCGVVDPTCQTAEVCNNCQDDDRDGLIDLLDPDCPSSALTLKTGTLTLGQLTSGDERIRLQGTLSIAPETINPPADGALLSLIDADGQIACLSFPPGAGWVTKPGLQWAFNNNELSLKFNAGKGSFVLTVKLKDVELNDPEAGQIGTMLHLGTKGFVNQQEWHLTNKGKKLVTP